MRNLILYGKVSILHVYRCQKVLPVIEEITTESKNVKSDNMYFED